jgi:hypothetical protein
MSGPGAARMTALGDPTAWLGMTFELRNVVANYSFESSRGFPRSEPNSGHGTTRV